MHDLPDDPLATLRWNGLTIGILVTLVWMLLAGLWVQHRHDVPSIAEYKATQTHVAACNTADVVVVNQCLDDNYDRLLADWRVETGVVVVLPPMIAWILALLRNISMELGLFRRRKEA